MQNKTDYALAILVGFFTGIFAIPTLINLDFRNKPLLILLPLAVPILFVFGIWFSKLLGRISPFLVQFGRFVAVGFLNTSIDFGILNLLSIATGIAAGLRVGGINIPGFSVAVINSYFWNKFWVFRERNPGGGLLQDLPKFLGVTVVGLLINSGIIVLMTTYASPPFHANPNLWLNLAKVTATIVSLVWNFVGYKFLVFARSAAQRV